MDNSSLWALIDAERTALATQMAELRPQQWHTPSLCAGLSVREVLAHMTVSGVLSGPRWFAGVLRARFDFDKQVDQRLREQLGVDAQETRDRFRATIGSRVSPPLPKLALLGEMVVHGQDIRRPLGLNREFPAGVLLAVANYYAGTNQVVVAKGRIRGLRLEADDGAFATGSGPLVRGGTLALIMAMTRRGVYCDVLSGPGVPELATRASARDR